MTQEEIQQKAYEVYPLDLDRHLIIEGEPYDNNKEKREAYIKGLIDSKLSIPSNLDEAAKKYELSIGSQDYCYLDIEDAFKAGAEWQKEQMMKEAANAYIFKSYNPATEQGEPTLHAIEIELVYEDEGKPYLIAGQRARIIILPKEEK